MRVSFECSEIIEELKADIEEFGGDAQAYGIWEDRKYKIPFSDKYGTINLLVDYLIGPEVPTKEDLQGGTAILSDLNTLLKIFEEENRI